MSHDLYIYGIKIQLDSGYTSDSEIGLFAVPGDNSQIRWAEAPLVDVAEGVDSWATNFVVDIGEQVKRADFRRGGNTAQLQPMTITIENANLLVHRLEVHNIRLTGLKCEIIEFVGTEADSDATERTTYATMRIDAVGQWNETELRLTLVPSLDANRRANILTQNDVETIPATFGSHNYAKILRTSDIDNTLSADDIQHLITPPSTMMFPIGAKNLYNGAYVEYTCALGTGGATVPTFTWQAPANPTYVKALLGDRNGQIRRVTEWQIATLGVLSFRTEHVFEDGDLTTSGDNQTWVKFFERLGEYEADIFPCYGFVNDNGATVSTGANIYTYDKDKKDYTRLPDYSIDVAQDNVDKNSLKANPRLTGSSADMANSFLILPVKNLALENTASLLQWGLTGYSRHVSGAYVYGQFMSSSLAISNLSNANDGDTDSYANMTGHIDMANAGNSYALALTFEMPDIPDWFTPDASEMYLMVKSTDTYTFFGDPSLLSLCQSIYRFKWRRLWGNAVAPMSRQRTGISCISPTVQTFANFPNFYNKNISAFDKYFYQEAPSVGANHELISGYKIMKIEPGADSDVDMVKSLYKMLLFIERVNFKQLPILNDLRIHEIAVAFKKSADIDKEIYSKFKGRIYGDTWSSRKTASDMINNPVDILEHTKRLQNWSELGTSQNWGHEYGTGALIKTSSDGSFDDSTLSTVAACRPAFQLTDYDEGYTDIFSKKLCEAFFLANYQDRQGYECVKFLLSDENPADKIELGDLIAGSDVVIAPPSPADVFCNPVVKYAYDQAAGEYTAELRVTNTDKSTWNSTYTSGFESDEDAETVWTLCRMAWLRFRSSEIMPDGMAECKMITTYADALKRIKWIVEWMQKSRTEATVSYLKARTWDIGKHILLQLPHQTLDTEIECVIESIRRSKSKNRTTLGLVLIEDIPGYSGTTIGGDYYIQKTLDVQSSDANNWVKKLDTGGAIVEKQKVL